MPACKRKDRLVKLRHFSSEAHTVMIYGGCLNCFSQISKQNILHLWALCASNWIKSWYSSLRKFAQYFHFFVCTAGHIAMPCLQLMVCVLCTPLHILSLHEHKIQMIYRRSDQTISISIWPYTNSLLFHWYLVAVF